jgi:branched-chain amino acid transport system permease protein
MVEFLLLSLGGARIGAIYALAAIGLVVIHKATRTVNFAHGAFIMLGAYGSFIGIERWGMPYWLVYIVVPVAVGAVAMAFEFLVLRRLRLADAFSVVITTVFASLLITEWIRIVFESESLTVPPVFSGSLWVIGSVIVTRETVWIVAGAFLSGVAGVYLFSRAGIGRAMRAMSANIRGAQLCGYSVNAVYAQAWLLGGGLAGLAGVFAAPRFGVSPDLAAATIIPAFVAAIIGGFDSPKGAILGGLLLGLLETYSAAFLPAAFKNAFTFILLLGILLTIPDGLFPERKARHV